MAAMVAGDFRPVQGKLCPCCQLRGEWPGQPCPDCKRANLKRANEIKEDRFHLRLKVADGSVSLVDVLADPPECVLSMLPAALLAWQYKWGPDRAEAAVLSADVFDARPVGSLTSRQLLLLSEAVA